MIAGKRPPRTVCTMHTRGQTHEDQSRSRISERRDRPAVVVRFLGVDGVQRQLLTVFDGGHEFDTAGEVPSESQVVNAVVNFFVRTLMQHRGPAQGA